MKLCIDVDYRGAVASVGAIGFRKWDDPEGAENLVFQMQVPSHYQPGEFYRRELPCLLAAIEAVSCPVEALIIDGYVWLDGGKPGLGAHLHRSLDEKVPVIGVAKNPFSQASDVELVYRGTSKRPLYVSAAGVDLRQAAQTIYRMHGEHRLPTLLKRVDRLCRDGLSRN